VTILAFLQCMWVRDPEKVAAIYARKPGLDRRAELNRRFLFRQSLTGRRLTKAFGDLCGQIIWEETTTEIGGESSFNPAPDPAHIRSVLTYFKPDAILLFGRTATNSVRPIAAELCPGATVISGTHPTARHADTQINLRGLACGLRRFIGAKAASLPLPAKGERGQQC
jgi:hypothetical protein